MLNLPGHAGSCQQVLRERGEGSRQKCQRHVQQVDTEHDRDTDGEQCLRGDDHGGAVAERRATDVAAAQLGFTERDPRRPRGRPS